MMKTFSYYYSFVQAFINENNYNQVIEQNLKRKNIFHITLY